MKYNTRRWVSIIAMLLMLACLATTVGCQFQAIDSNGGTTQDPTGNGSNNGGNNNGNGNGNGNTPGNNVTYTVRVKSIGGLALPEVTLSVEDDNGNIKGFGKTNAEGIATISGAAGATKVMVRAEDAPEGYAVDQNGYALAANGADVVLVSSLIANDDNSFDFTKKKYELGDVMHDFSVTTPEGTVYKLSEILKTKDAVMLNFWYTTCVFCVEEFPYLEQAYQQYSQDVEVLALDPTDSASEIAAFKRDFNYSDEESGLVVNGLSFPMMADTEMVSASFVTQGYPTSVMIDRYGVVCMIVDGAIPSARKFSALFSHFAAVDYRQTLIEDPSVLTPLDKPNVSMPSSDEIGAVLDKGAVKVTYSPEANDEYSWPFLIGELNGEQVIYASNTNKHSSYATLYAKVSLKAGQALAFDYFSSTQKGSDVLYVLIDREDVFQISGVSTEWETCYPFVAVEDGEYELALCYLKNDDDVNTGADTVYLKNLRTVSPDLIDIPTYIPRFCATGLLPDMSGYEHYVDVKFNPADGYYHIYDETLYAAANGFGPILLADLLGATPFNPQTSVWIMAYSDGVIVNGVNYKDQIEAYASYASNSRFYGLCPVTEELAQILKIVAQIGWNNAAENQWLEMCMYYSAYGTGGKELADPIQGLADFSAFPTVETTDPNNIQHNSVTYDRILVPRGLKYKFVPAKSGAYRITSHNSAESLNAWVFKDGGEIYYQYELSERLWENYHDENNMTMVVYLEEGVNYYINIAYWSVDSVGSFTFDVQYVAESVEVFTVASPGYYTYELNEITGELGETIAGGIDVILGDDGYYYELREDGSVGSKVYADFTGTTIFSHSILQMIEMGGFDLSKDANDREILDDIDAIGRYLLEDMLTEKKDDSDFMSWVAEYQVEDVLAEKYHGVDKQPSEKDQEVLDYIDKLGRENFESYIRDLYKDDSSFNYDQWAAKMKVDEVMAGIYHGIGDKTEIMRAYAEQILTAEGGAPEELVGCIAVNKELGDILYTLMATYAFEADHAWTKLCYYYRYVGPVSTNA